VPHRANDAAPASSAQSHLKNLQHLDPACVGLCRGAYGSLQAVRHDFSEIDTAGVRDI
jgi:hypothetical protein